MTGAVVAISRSSRSIWAIAYLKRVFPAFDRLLEGRPILLIDRASSGSGHYAHGLDDDDLKEAARLSHGLTDMEDVRQATLERDGNISIVPWRDKKEMSKRARIIIGCLIAAIIVAGAGIVISARQLEPRLRDWVASTLSESLDSEVELGSVRLQLGAAAAGSREPHRSPSRPHRRAAPARREVLQCGPQANGFLGLNGRSCEG